jgi:hypothetical protein
MVSNGVPLCQSEAVAPGRNLARTAARTAWPRRLRGQLRSNRARRGRRRGTKWWRVFADDGPIWHVKRANGPVVLPCSGTSFTDVGSGCTWRRGPAFCCNGCDPRSHVSRQGSRCGRVVSPRAVRTHHTQLLHAKSQRVRVDAEALRRISGAIDPPAASFEDGLDVGTLNSVEIVWRFCVSSDPRAERQGCVQLQRAPAGGDHRPLDDVLELTHVARPGVVLQRVHDALRDLGDVPAQVALVPVDEEPDQPRNVVHAIPQGW